MKIKGKNVKIHFGPQAVYNCHRTHACSTVFVNNSCSDFQKNVTNRLVAGTRSQTEAERSIRNTVFNSIQNIKLERLPQH